MEKYQTTFKIQSKAYPTPEVAAEKHHWTGKDVEYLRGALESLRLEINKLWITEEALQAEIEKVSDEMTALEAEIKLKGN